MDHHELRNILIEIIEEEFCPNPVELAPRWAGGSMVLNPSNDTQAKEIPLEALFRKVTGIRESLRVLEQKVNNHKSLSPEDKASLQGYITKCYGSLTTFNILFKEDKDKFRGGGGSGGGGKKNKESLSYNEAQKQLGLNISPSRY